MKLLVFGILICIWILVGLRVVSGVCLYLQTKKEAEEIGNVKKRKEKEIEKTDANELVNAASDASILNSKRQSEINKFNSKLDMLRDAFFTKRSK